MADNGKNDSVFGGLLPLSEAAVLAGTTPDYLRYLIFKNKLQGQKFGKIWFTRKEWLHAYFNPKVIKTNLSKNGS
ncbi:MAG: hypothetical protein Q8Q95_04000, partial [bacterium]|nr:hypothetical protein [bacterium]